MDVTDLVRRLLRRWIVTLAVVVLAVLAGGASYARAGTSDQSSAAVVIVPPFLGEAALDQNPLLNLDNNLAQLAAVLATAMSAPGVVPGLDGTVTYTISTVTGTNPSFAQLSPQLNFTVTAATAPLARSSATALVAGAETRLDALQDQLGVPFLSRAKLVVVVAPTPAVSAGSSQLRAGGAVGLGILVLGLLGVLLLDELVSRRSQGPRPDLTDRPAPPARPTRPVRPERHTPSRP